MSYIAWFSSFLFLVSRFILHLSTSFTIDIIRKMKKKKTTNQPPTTRQQIT